jgi:hypothetical protein
MASGEFEQNSLQLPQQAVRLRRKTLCQIMDSDEMKIPIINKKARQRW